MRHVLNWPLNATWKAPVLAHTQYIIYAYIQTRRQVYMQPTSLLRASFRDGTLLERCNDDY